MRRIQGVWLLPAVLLTLGLVQDVGATIMSQLARKAIDLKGQTIEQTVDSAYWERTRPAGVLTDLPSALLELKRSASEDTAAQLSTLRGALRENGSIRFVVFPELDLRDASLTKGVDFTTGVFLGSVRLEKADVESDAYCIWTTFGSNVEVTGARFRSKAFFPRSRFDSTSTFFIASFDSTAEFVAATFVGTVDFIQTRFASTADFRWVDFQSDADFRATQFGPKADFTGARFARNVSFESARLPDTLDLSRVRVIGRDIDLTLCGPPRSGGRCSIKLLGADLGKIRLNMRLFNLYFEDSTTDDQRSSIYEGVLKKLQADGLMDGYRILDIEYRQWKYRRDGQWLWNILQDCWWKYGYERGRVLRWAGLFWFAFWLIALIKYRDLQSGVYGIDFLEQHTADASPARCGWLRYGLRTLTYTGFVFFGLKMDLNRFRSGAVRKHPWLFGFLMFMYTLGILCLGFVVNWIFH